jgi:hypothetical protein
MAMNREPPDYSFSPIIANGGDVIVPHVLRRLRAEQADYRKADIIVILRDFCRLNDCKEGREDIIRAVKEAVAGIESPGYRQIAERSLAGMKGESVPMPRIEGSNKSN